MPAPRSKQQALSRVPRQRRIALGVAVLALVAGGIVGAGHGGDERPASARTSSVAATPTSRSARRNPGAAVAPARTDPVRLAGAVVLMRFDGPQAPAYVLAALRAGRAAGVTLFDDNVVSPAQVRRLTATLQHAAGGDALIATDQEGGAVRQLPFAAPEESQPVQATQEAARAAAEATAEDLHAVGVNVNLAPVADLPEGPVVRGRAYPGGPKAVARLVGASVRGAQAGGIAATAKHFPGLAGAAKNTDDAPVSIDRSGREGVVPFRAAADADVSLIMVGHALYPRIDPDRIASQSPAVLRLLRAAPSAGGVGFRGVAVTDSLEAEAVVARSEVDVAALRSLRAGVDLLLTTGKGSHLRVLRRLSAAIARDPATRARAQEAARRVGALRERLAAAGPQTRQRAPER